ncbi:MAG: hypothetical protein QOF30_3246 [Acidimicrobiaceae bacterium]|nr:hypothetical protein [Acidimicrobiaceae bacterium]
MGGFAALGALVGFFAAVAVGLVVLAGQPVPALSSVRLAIELHYLAPQLVRQLAACVAWPCLAWLAIGVLRMGAATWQDKPTRPAMGTAWLLPFVRRAVAALVLFSALFGRSAAWSAPTGVVMPTSTAVVSGPYPMASGSRAAVTALPRRGEVLVGSPAADHVRPTAARRAATTVKLTAAVAEPGAQQAMYRVRVGDELWDIAGTQLHDPLQWKAIWELNRGKVMVDVYGGRRVFDDKSLILPGWDLQMPSGWSPADTSARVPVTAASDQSSSTGGTTPTVGSSAATAAATVPVATTVPVQATTVPDGPAVPVPAVAGTSAASGSGRGELPRSGRSVPVGPVVGVGALAAAGVVWMLGRHRREQTLARATGRDIPTTPAPMEAVERRVRVIADHEAMRWVDLGLRYLGQLIENLDDPPGIVLVRAGSVGLEVMVDPPTVAAPGRFVAVDGGITWGLEASVDLAELERLAGNRWPPVPALVTIGETAAGTVLANLEHAGSLAIEGDPERQRGLLLQILVELTSQPWTDQTLSGVHVLGDAGLDGELPGVDVDDDPMFMAQVLDQLSDRYQRDIDAPSVVVRRAMDGGWEPHVAVAFADAAPDVLRCVIESAIPDRSGVAVVAAGPVDGARWRLEVDAAGMGTLSARIADQLFVMEMRVDPDAEVMTMVAADLAHATEPADRARVVGLRDALPDEAAVRKGPVEISVLGPLDVAGGSGPDAVESKRRRPALALLAYMSTHRGPVTNQELGRALWPLDTTKANFGGGAPSTVHNVVNHAKSILGRGPHGEELLISTPDGYTLTDGVTSDWARFSKFAAVAEGEEPQTRIATWCSALQLVRGVPLESNYPGKYFEWFGSERLDDKIRTRVVDVATLLATAALELEDWDTVRWAVQKGLDLDSAREELFQALMHAEGRSGRPTRVHEVYGQLCLMLQKEVDALQTPSDESEEIWKSYRR